MPLKELPATPLRLSSPHLVHCHDQKVNRARQTLDGRGGPAKFEESRRVRNTTRRRPENSLQNKQVNKSPHFSGRLAADPLHPHLGHIDRGILDRGAGFPPLQNRSRGYIRQGDALVEWMAVLTWISSRSTSWETYDEIVVLTGPNAATCSRRIGPG